MHASDSLEGARSWLRSRVDEGARCPCCTQFAKVYKRSIHGAMARVLILIGKTSTDWIHIPSLLTQNKISSPRGGEVAMLSMWNLLEEKRNDDEGKTRCSGYYEITPTGLEFIHNYSTVTKYAHIYDGRLLRHSGEQVSIIDTLGEKFNYQELMRR